MSSTDSYRISYQYFYELCVIINEIGDINGNIATGILTILILKISDIMGDIICATRKHHVIC
jgi:Mg2+/Co2+ transporter CorB